MGRSECPPGPDELACLRCKGAALRALLAPAAMAVFECGRCGRQYARRPGRALCFRWPHPIGRALYPVQFDRHPAPRAGAVAAMLTRGASAAARASIAREIALELGDPTQRVGDIVDCRASEAELRRYLGLVVAHLESRPAG